LKLKISLSVGEVRKFRYFGAAYSDSVQSQNNRHFWYFDLRLFKLPREMKKGKNVSRSSSKSKNVVRIWLKFYKCMSARVRRFHGSHDEIISQEYLIKFSAFLFDRNKWKMKNEKRKK